MLTINTLSKEIKEWIMTILLAVVLVLIIRTFVMDSRIVPTTSMVPTIIPQDRLFVEKITHRFSGLHRGEVIVFKPPVQSGLKDDLIKRLIGLPGDTVEVKNGKLYVNDVVQNEPYLAEPMQYSYKKVTVPEGKLFVLGDNRNRSYDSHEWGFVDITSVKGKAFITYWPLHRFKVW
ncbi:MAG: signal peptidase [Peptococcaceae bacterium]|nr:signal peptidase [Peptococcaceae bacterium]